MHETTTKRNRPCIMRYIHYNKEKDPENFFREKMILYVPQRDKCVFQKNKFKTWYQAFLVCKEQIDAIEQNFLATPSKNGVALMPHLNSLQKTIYKSLVLIHQKTKPLPFLCLNNLTFIMTSYTKIPTNQKIELSQNCLKNHFFSPLMKIML